LSPEGVQEGQEIDPGLLPVKVHNAAEASILRSGVRCINIQGAPLRVEPTASLLAADIAKVPLLIA
jgi:hypothetical protein